MSPILWQPTSEAAAASNMSRFMAYASSHTGRAFADYDELHAWSVEKPGQFWFLLWQFCDMLGDLTEEPAASPDGRMFGTRFFPNGMLNYGENLLKRRDDLPAFIYEAEGSPAGVVSFRDLYDRVSVMMQALRRAGVGEGDRVAAIVPNTPEAAVAMIATVSLGAIWSSCSPDFGAAGILDRFSQIEPKVLITVDGYRYNGKVFSILDRLADIANGLPSAKTIVLEQFIDADAQLELSGRTVLSGQEFLGGIKPGKVQFERFPFSHPALILFSSGTTGKPKCIVHSAGGVLMMHICEHALHANVKPGDRVFGFSTTGWMLWNWLMSALSLEATVVLYDGSPTYPESTSLFDFVERNRVAVWQTSARFLDSARKTGVRPADNHDFPSLKVINSTGSVLPPETYDYVYADLKEDVRLSSVSGGTDICGCFVIGNPLLPVRRGEIQCKVLGMDADVFDADGKPVIGEKGELVCKSAFPSMPVSFWNDEDGSLYFSSYFDEFDNVWAHGDYALKTPDDTFVIFGRSDTVLNPGGVRIGTAEIYQQVEKIPEVVESCVVSQDWDDDTRVVLFVVLKPGLKLTDSLRDEIKKTIRKHASPRHVPARILQVTEVPKTPTGKIVEVAVRNIINGRSVKNRDSLINPDCLRAFENLPELQE